MSKFDYKRANQTAQRLIVNFGTTCVVEHSASVYNPVSGEQSSVGKTTFDAHCVILRKETAPSEPLANHKTARAIISAPAGAFAVEANDVVRSPIAGNYKILSVSNLEPAGELVFISADVEKIK